MNKISTTKLLQRQQQQKRDYMGVLGVTRQHLQFGLAQTVGEGCTITCQYCWSQVMWSFTILITYVLGSVVNARDLVFISMMNEFTSIDCTVYWSGETINQAITLWWEMGHFTVLPQTIIMLSLGVILNSSPNEQQKQQTEGFSLPICKRSIGTSGMFGLKRCNPSPGENNIFTFYLYINVKILQSIFKR